MRKNRKNLGTQDIIAEGNKGWIWMIPVILLIIVGIVLLTNIDAIVTLLN